MKVYVNNNNINQAYKVLSKRLNDEGFFRELRDREFFSTRTQKKRLKREKAIVRIKKEERKRLAQFSREEQNLVFRSKRKSNGQI
jgi:ribosomal protein S21